MLTGKESLLEIFSRQLLHFPPHFCLILGIPNIAIISSAKVYFRCSISLVVSYNKITLILFEWHTSKWGLSFNFSKSFSVNTVKNVISINFSRDWQRKIEDWIFSVLGPSAESRVPNRKKIDHGNLMTKYFIVIVVLWLLNTCTCKTNFVNL